MVLIVGTARWSEFLLEQLAFCRMLHQTGARAIVLYDKPIRVMAANWNADIWGCI